ncbi:MipA/OmpV family protein [Alteromonas ponticola]|uniref:MipA/OmpV family protein n=1 Tax=Alteromonas aquimaris TaxID=2998417 RepID=A0ABT3P3U1_9ALTE|nr:MipA/OmpV family protein [Alteromonas aquimaris]MCW8107435.1 MipA/OmpV family protein [Alteromonas aquimaris]
MKLSSIHFLHLLWLFYLLVFAEPAKAQKKIEAGIGGFAVSLPAYPGSADQSTYVLPFPYFYYKDDRVTVDREGVVGNLLDGDHWEIDVSFSGGIPVRSEDAAIRTGMPDLDWTAEAGPRLLYYVLGNDERDAYIRTHLFVRKAYASDFRSISDIGTKIGLGVEVLRKVTVFDEIVTWTNRLTVNWADDRNLNYFYGVAAQYATSSRPMFTTHSGYAGTELSSGITVKVDNIWLGFFARYQHFANTAQENSALLEVGSNWTAGIGLVWVFYRK